MKKIILILGIIFLLSGTSIIPSVGIQIDNKPIITSNMGNTLYVGGNGSGNYSKIQDAIDNASDGDTVFVYDDSSPYYENIVVNKSINLIGEDKENTDIVGYYHRHVIKITANYVYINGFCIKHYSFDTGDSGISIQNSINNTIQNNKITSNFYGILLGSSTGNTIKDNGIFWNEVGISFDASSNNTLIVNNISYNYNWGTGIQLIDSTNNIITDNIFFGNTYNGITLWNSNNNLISDNIFKNHYSAGLSLSNSNSNNILKNSFYNDGIWIKYSYQNNLSNNTVNEKPIVYYEDESDSVIDEDVGQVILVSCNNISIQNQVFSNVCVGIVLIDTNYCLISKNIKNCLYLYQSNSNNIVENAISIRLYDYCCNNNIIGNNIKNKGRLYLHTSCCNNTIKGNNITNNYDGILLYNKCNNNIIIDNNISNNKDEFGWGQGISLDGMYNSPKYRCENNTIAGNLIANNGRGIYLNLVDNNVIYNNSILKNNHDGIKLFGCFKNKIFDNDIISNNDCGIMLDGSSNNIFTSNNVISNKEDGIHLCYYMHYPSSNNSIFHNNIINNAVNTYDECNNSWDNEVSGNFWSDYNGTDNDEDGIGDAPYPIPGGDNQDRYPLMEPWGDINLPPDAPIIDGPIRGILGKTYDYEFLLFDFDNDTMYLRIDWGNGTPSQWYGPYDSGIKVKFNHTWEKKGTYKIRAQSKDDFDLSDWCEFTVTMPRDKSASSSPLLRFLERYPLLNLLFQKFLS